MAKTAKKNYQESPEIVPEAPIPIQPAEESPLLVSDEPTSTPNDENQPDEDTPTADRPRVGRWPKAFGDSERGILARLMDLDSWEGVWAYVYRIQPFSNRLVGGNRKIHVKRYDSAFDAEMLMQEAGSGVYQIQCTRLNPITGKRPMFDSGEVIIFNQNHPPKIPLSEWVDDPKNKEWAWAREAIMKQNAPVAPPPAPPGPDPLVEILREQIKGQNDQMAELRKEMRETAAAAAAPKPKDPGEQTLMTVLAGILPAVVQKIMAPPPDPIAQLTAAMQLLKQTAPEPAKPADDPISILDRQLDLQKKIDEAAAARNPGTVRSRKTGTQEMITDIAEAVAPVLQPIVQVIALGMAQQAQRNAQQPPPQQQQQPPAAQQPPMPEVLPPAPPAAAAEPPSPGPQIVQPKIPTMDVIARAAANLIEEGKTGYEFGDWYLTTYGEKEFSEAREQGKKKLLDDLRAVPGTSSFLAMHPKELDELVSEFIKWEPADEEFDETPMDPTIDEIWANTQQEIGVKP